MFQIHTHASAEANVMTFNTPALQLKSLAENGVTVTL